MKQKPIYVAHVGIEPPNTNLRHLSRAIERTRKSCKKIPPGMPKDFITRLENGEQILSPVPKEWR